MRCDGDCVCMQHPMRNGHHHHHPGISIRPSRRSEPARSSCGLRKYPPPPSRRTPTEPHSGQKRAADGEGEPRRCVHDMGRGHDEGLSEGVEGPLRWVAGGWRRGRPVCGGGGGGGRGGGASGGWGWGRGRELLHEGDVVAAGRREASSGGKRRDVDVREGPAGLSVPVREAIQRASLHPNPRPARRDPDLARRLARPNHAGYVKRARGGAR
jgi:hypothetical protein